MASPTEDFQGRRRDLSSLLWSFLASFFLQRRGGDGGSFWSVSHSQLPLRCALCAWQRCCGRSSVPLPLVPGAAPQPQWKGSAGTRSPQTRTQVAVCPGAHGKEKRCRKMCSPRAVPSAASEPRSPSSDVSGEKDPLYRHTRLPLQRSREEVSVQRRVATDNGWRDVTHYSLLRGQKCARAGTESLPQVPSESKSSVRTGRGQSNPASRVGELRLGGVPLLGGVPVFLCFPGTDSAVCSVGTSCDS